MINKHQAALLWANNYRLVDKEGREYSILEPHESGFTAKRGFINYHVFYQNLGVDYFILAKPLSDLTNEITHEGKGQIIPIDFINWKIGVKDTIWYEYLGGGKIMEVIKDAERNQKITYEKPSEYPYFLHNIISEMHFNLGFPEEAVKSLKN